MSSYKVRLLSEVLEGLEAVRRSGRTNMFDVSGVISLALGTGYPKAATWVEEHLGLYAQGLMVGFEAADTPEDGGDAQCAD